MKKGFYLFIACLILGQWRDMSYCMFLHGNSVMHSVMSCCEVAHTTNIISYFKNF